MPNKKKRTHLRKKAKPGKVNRVKTRKPQSKVNQRPPKSTNLTPLGECLRDYAVTSMNPFRGKPTCLPHEPAVPSLKMRSTARGAFVIGTSGDGYVACGATPYSSTTISTTAYSVYHSTSAYGGSGFPTMTGQTLRTGQNGVWCNSPYASADFKEGQGLQYRVVACGIRCRYLGTELNRSGRIICFEDPNHDAIGGRTTANLLAYEWVETEGNDPDRPWYCALYQPKYSGEYNYLVSHASATPFMGVLATGMNAGDAFEFEYYVFTEIVGSNLPSTTQSEADNGILSRLTTQLGQFTTTMNDRFSEMSPAHLLRVATNMVKVASAANQIMGYGPPRAAEPLRLRW
jgi:hypothetical protein